MVTCEQDPVEPGEYQAYGPNQADKPPPFYLLTVHARWVERDYAEHGIGRSGISRGITFKSAVLVRAEL